MKTVFSKIALSCGALILSILATGTAHADTFTFQGINTGVTGQATINQQSSSLLNFTVTNTSTASTGTTGTITSIGFDLPGVTTPPNSTNFSLASSTNTNYRLETGVSGNASGINRTFDFALLTGPNFNGGSSPNQGIQPGASATFQVSGDFSAFTQQQIAQGIFLRFQRVNGDDSDVARFNGGQPVPEPATMLLLSTGLAGIAAKARKRRKAAKNNTEA